MLVRVASYKGKIEICFIPKGIDNTNMQKQLVANAR
jgi:hypothetical protein